MEWDKFGFITVGTFSLITEFFKCGGRGRLRAEFAWGVEQVGLHWFVLFFAAPCLAAFTGEEQSCFCDDVVSRQPHWYGICSLSA